MNPFIVPSAWTWHYVAGRYRGEWPGRIERVTGITGGVDFVLNLRSDLLVAAMVICGSWADFSARGRARGGEMSLAIPRRDTGHATAPLNPQVMSTATRHPRWRRRDCLRGVGGKGEGAHKRTYAGTEVLLPRLRKELPWHARTGCPSRRGILANRS